MMKLDGGSSGLRGHGPDGKDGAKISKAAGGPKGPTKYRRFVGAIGQVKKASALANKQIGILDDTKADAICAACDEIAGGEFDPLFAPILEEGTWDGINTTANRLIEERANQLLEHARDGAKVDAWADVNLCQSSIDVILTAMSITLHDEIGRVIAAAGVLEKALARKATEFASVVKVGRIGLRDSVPITLGQEFSGYLAGIVRNRTSIEHERAKWSEGVLGATAVGTSLGCAPGFLAAVYRHLSALCGWEVRCAENLFDGLQARDSYVVLHAHLLALALAAGRIAQDLRIMSSGPRGGLAEITLPAVQPGSSIMPGKVNPVVAEQMYLVTQRLAGNQAGIGMAASFGELDVGSRSGVLIRSFLESIDLLCRGLTIFTERCVSGVVANVPRCKDMAERSCPRPATLALLGSQAVARIERAAHVSGVAFLEAVLKDKELPENTATTLSDVAALTDATRTEGAVAAISHRDLVSDGGGRPLDINPAGTLQDWKRL